MISEIKQFVHNFIDFPSRRREDMKARHAEELRKFDVDAIQGCSKAIVVYLTRKS